MTRFGLPRIMDSDNSLPERVVGYVSVRGQQSVFASPRKPLASSSKAYHAKKSDMASVRRSLEQLGFRIIAQSPLGLSVEGSPGQFEELTGGKLLAKERLMRDRSGVQRYVTCLDVVGKNQPKTLGVAKASSKKLKVDGIVLESPKTLHSVFPSPIPPNSAKYHLRVPNDVATILAAASLHQQGTRGDGVTVAMPDTGWYRHPYFIANGYNVKTPLVTVEGTKPNQDPDGHGTGISANLLAMAPGAVLQPIRATNDNGTLVSLLAAFQMAKELRPKIITNSWTSSNYYPPPDDWATEKESEADRAIILEIQHAIEEGMIVVFASGNGLFSVEPQIPGVISAGGVYCGPQGQMQASDYASGYKSPWTEVIVPTVCGLSGMVPRAQYLMLPVPPGSARDEEESNEGDGTAPDDGWALFSGSSAAAAQVAGSVALLLGAKPNLTCEQVTKALTETAIDVIRGHSASRPVSQLAGQGLDYATGFGLIDAAAAVEYANRNF